MNKPISVLQKLSVAETKYCECKFLILNMGDLDRTAYRGDCDTSDQFSF